MDYFYSYIFSDNIPLSHWCYNIQSSLPSVFINKGVNYDRLSILNEIDFVLKNLEKEDTLTLSFDAEGLEMTNQGNDAGQGIWISGTEFLSDFDITNLLYQNRNDNEDNIKENTIVFITDSCDGNGLFLNFNYPEKSLLIDSNIEKYNLENLEINKSYFAFRTNVDYKPNKFTSIAFASRENQFLSKELQDIHYQLVGISNYDTKTQKGTSQNIVEIIRETNISKTDFFHAYFNILMEINTIFFGFYNYKTLGENNFSDLLRIFNNIKKIQ